MYRNLEHQQKCKDFEDLNTHTHTQPFYGSLDFDLNIKFNLTSKVQKYKMFCGC